jgi:filamentous hemagglutinin
VNKTPDLNHLLDKQSDTMAAASAAGEAVARRIGDYADAQAKATGDPAWAEGGHSRAEMQAAGAALIGGLGGGVASAAGSVAGAGLASLAAGQLNTLSDSIASSSPTGNADMDRTLGNIVANVIATGAGAAVGGGDAGAFAGYNVDRFNRQLHPEEKKVIKDLANGDAEKAHRLEAAGCALVHCAAEYVPGTTDYIKYSALEKEGASYTAEQMQLQSYNATLFSTAGSGGMVRVTPGNILFRYSADDARADSSAFISNALATQPGFGLSLGANAQGHLFSVGVGADVGVTVGLGGSPNMCVYAQACGNYGLGFYAGAGISATLSQGAPSTGSSLSKGGFLAGGVGPVADIAITRDTSSGAISAGKGVIGIGGGFAAGGTQCKQYSGCAGEK